MGGGSAPSRPSIGRRKGGGGVPGCAAWVQRGKRETLTPGERRHLIQLVACGSIFVLLVAVKLLLPGRMAQVNAKLTGMLEQNIDVQAVFSAVGRAVSGEADVDVALQDMYQAVFDPQEDSAVEVSAPGGEAVSLQLPAAIAPLRPSGPGPAAATAGWICPQQQPRRQRPRRQQRPIRQRRLRKPHPRARRRRLPWPTSSTPTRTCRTTCAWNRPCWALITAPR
ncbi:MAG: hypothetical protein ACLTYN_09575 [Dysosmobacter welbionis]